jgi:hypothetical protein
MLNDLFWDIVKLYAIIALLFEAVNCYVILTESDECIGGEDF